MKVIQLILQIAILVMLFVAIGFQIRTQRMLNDFNRRQRLPSASALVPDKNGIIHHPLYGDYPAQVPYRQGMDIMPGQEAVVKVPISGD